MRASESAEHLQIKNIVGEKLQEWLGASLGEYPSSGHELDVYAVTDDGIRVYAEIIWSTSRTHFLSDMSMIQQSDADIKLVIGSTAVVRNRSFTRDFRKVVISERSKGHIVYGTIVDGSQILGDSHFLDQEFKKLISKLVNDARNKSPVVKQIVPRPSTRPRVTFSLRHKGELNKSLRDYASAIVSDYENFSDFTRRGVVPVIEQVAKFDLKLYFVQFDVRDLRSYLNLNGEDMVFGWMKAESRRGLLILGDFGAGKSSLCAYVACKLAEQYLEKKSNRVPVFVALRELDEISQESTLRAVNSVIDVDSETFTWMCREGKLLIILDGFDEIVKRTDWSKVRSDFRQILDLFCVGKSKVILTCRTHYFLKDSHIWGEETALMEETKASDQFRIITIEPFSEKQILDFIRRHSTDSERIWARIKETYDLTDLCTRPLLADMIVSYLPEIVSMQRPIDIAVLYDTYTNSWIKKEDWRSQLRPSSKAGLMEEIAADMFTADVSTINFQKIREIIEEKLKVKATSEPADYYDYDLRTCSFFNRDSEGNYRFMHKSFLEFFFAKRVAREINNESWTSLVLRQLTREVLEFAASMIDPEKKLVLWRALYETRNMSLDGGGFLGGNALSLLKRLRERLDDRDYSGCAIANVEIASTDLLRCTFDKARLRQIVFSYSTMRNCSFRNAHLESCKFNGTRFDNAVFDGSETRESDFSGATLIASSLKSAVFNNTNLSMTLIHASDLSRGHFYECDARGACISNCDCRLSRFVRSSLSFANAASSKLGKTTFDHARLYWTSMGASAAKSIHVTRSLVKLHNHRLHRLSGAEGKIVSLVDPNLPAYCALDRAAGELSIPRPLEDKSLELFSRIEWSGYHGREAVMGACLYAICRNSKYPQRIDAICRHVRVRRKDLSREYRRLLSSGHVGRAPLNPTDCIVRLARRVRAKDRSVAIAKRLVSLSGRETMGRNPYGIAASALYLACRESHEKKSQTLIANAAGISTQTVGIISSILAKHCAEAVQG